MGRPHLLVIPYPAQGHVMPLMELSHNLADRGFKITFVHTEDTHKKVVAALSSTGNDYEEFVELVSIPDGLEASEEERKFLAAELIEIMIEKMPAYLEELINKINTSNDGNDRISCVIADLNCGWAVEVAEKLSIPRAVFLPASADLIATNLSIPKFIEDGLISEDGAIINEQTFQQSPTMPAKTTKDLSWLNMGGILAFEKVVFNMICENNRAVKAADYFLCNSFYDLEPSAFDLVPNLKPIGPIFASSKMAHFWAEDSTCLSWLDQQPPSSVIYVAFGSIAILDKKQFDELALGLELSGQRFLWVVRQDLLDDNKATVVYPDGFEERVGCRARIVAWAPQREVLAHPAVGCFLSHCGWNSTMEGISHGGVPFLCFPYFYDQIVNKKYICDVWKVGLGFNQDENGLISRKEIKTKVLEIFGAEEIKENALKLKEKARNNVSDGGVSSKNFDDFVQAIR
ncbi:hypothetical protein ACHQM5_005109 [Ranunculus cassubicifolius]